VKAIFPATNNTANVHLVDVHYYPGMNSKEQRQSMN